MTPWWEKWPGRLEFELAEFQRRSLQFAVDLGERAKGRILLRGRAPIAPGEEQDLIVVYPDTFPNMRPAIYAPQVSLDRHQNPFGKNLCVLPRSSIHWRPRMTAAELVAERVPYLVDLVRRGGNALRSAEEPQGEPISTYLTFQPIGGVLIPEVMLALHSDHMAGSFRLRFVDDPGWLTQIFEEQTLDCTWVGQALLLEVTSQKGEKLATAEMQLQPFFPGDEWVGRWVRLQEQPHDDAPAALLADAIEADQTLSERQYVSGYEVIGIVFQEEVRQEEYEDVWFFLVLEKPDQPKAQRLRLTLLRGMRYSPLDLAARIPELRKLTSVKVSVIGLGTLGSEVAAHLAKAQTNTLRLADHDYIEAATTVRWLSGIPASGGLKPFVLKAMLESDHPYVKVEPSCFTVGVALVESNGKSENELLRDWVADSSLVIDATAEQNVRRVIGYLGHELHLPQVFVWSVDGYGGVVAGLEPGKTGCILCLEKAITPDGGYVEPPPAAESLDRVTVQPRGCADRTFTGASIDLAPLAIEATRMAVSILSAGENGLYPARPKPVLVLKLREPDGTLVVPSWKGYELEPNPESCTLCALSA